MAYCRLVFAFAVLFSVAVLTWGYLLRPDLLVVVGGG